MSHSKPSQVPPNLPPYYPNDLEAQTHVILAQAVRKFLDQTRTLELCKYVICEMTPLFRAAVQTGRMRAERVLSDSGMGGLLHSILVYNCDNGDQRFRLAQEARKSDEWLKLAQEIADVSKEQSPKNWRTVEAIQVDPGLVKLGLIDFSLHRLNDKLTEDLHRMLAQAEERLGRLRQALPGWQTGGIGHDTEVGVVLAETTKIVNQLRIALAFRNALPATPPPTVTKVSPRIVESS